MWNFKLFPQSEVPMKYTLYLFACLSEDFSEIARRHFLLFCMNFGCQILENLVFCFFQTSGQNRPKKWFLKFWKISTHFFWHKVKITYKLKIDVILVWGFCPAMVFQVLSKIFAWNCCDFFEWIYSVVNI